MPAGVFSRCLRKKTAGKRARHGISQKIFVPSKNGAITKQGFKNAQKEKIYIHRTWTLNV
jgi:hypothetical protein